MAPLRSKTTLTQTFYNEDINQTIRDLTSSLLPENHRAVLSGRAIFLLIIAWVISLAIATAFIYRLHSITESRVHQCLNDNLLREIRHAGQNASVGNLIMSVPKGKREVVRAWLILDMHRWNLDIDEEVYKEYANYYVEGKETKRRDMEARYRIFVEENEEQRMNCWEFKEYWLSKHAEKRGGVPQGW